MTRNFMWTREGVGKILDLWETKTNQEIAEEMGITAPKVSYLVKQLRIAGHTLPRKRSPRGQTQIFLKEILKERGLIR